MKLMPWVHVANHMGISATLVRSIGRVALWRVRGELWKIRHDLLYSDGIDLYDGTKEWEDSRGEYGEPPNPWDEPGACAELKKEVTQGADYFWKRRGRSNPPHLSENLYPTYRYSSRYSSGYSNCYSSSSSRGYTTSNCYSNPCQGVTVTPTPTVTLTPIPTVTATATPTAGATAGATADAVAEIDAEVDAGMGQRYFPAPVKPQAHNLLYYPSATDE